MDAHPEETEPLGRAHQPSTEERHLSRILSIAIVAAILIVPIIAAISYSPVLNVLLGLSPLLVTLVLDIIATHQHYKPITFWIVLAVVHALGLAVLYLINLLLAVKMNVPAAVSVSLILGALVTAFCWLSDPAEIKKDLKPRKQHIVAFKPEKLQEYVQSIEDKIKAMNFAIGRVYRASNGATPKMRERLRVPSEWYNDFHAIKPEDLEEQKDKAKVLVRKIRDKLSTYSMKEKDVFSGQELALLKHLARHKDGEDTVLHVLKTNDRDPVEHYYVSAVEFCDRILEELERKG
jgi:hypothetical protein